MFLRHSQLESCVQQNISHYCSSYLNHSVSIFPVRSFDKQPFSTRADGPVSSSLFPLCARRSLRPEWRGLFYSNDRLSLCTVAINASGSSQTADLCDHIQTRPGLEIWNDATRTCFRRPGCVRPDSSLPPLPSIFSSSSSFLPASSVRSNLLPSAAAAAAHFCLDCWKDVSRCHIFLLITSKEKVKVWQDDEDQDLNTDGATAVCYSLMTWREISYLDVTPVVCTQI